MATDDQLHSKTVNASTAGPEVLERFWNLASLDETQRLESAASLISELEASQKAFKAEGSGQADGNTTISKPYKQQDIDKVLSESCSPLTVYSIHRLIKGLASGRQAARQGFALALALLLSRLPELPSEAVLGLLGIHQQATNSMSGADARDALLGRLFGLSALIKVRDLTKDLQLASEIASSILSMMASKAYLREASVCALLELTGSLKEKQLGALIAGTPALKELLTGPVDTATPEALAVSLHLWGKLPKEVLNECKLLPQNTKAPSKSFLAAGKDRSEPHPHSAAQAFFTANHFQSVLGALKSSTSSHPRVHHALLATLGLLIPNFTSSKAAAAAEKEKVHPESRNVANFWRMFVEDELLCSSNERKFLGFQLFNILLPFLGADQIPVVFSSSFSQLLASSLAKKDSMLHPAAKKAMSRIQAIAEQSKDPDTKAAFAVVLQRQPGSTLSQHVKSKGTSGILQAMDLESTKKYLIHLREVFEGKASLDSAGPGSEGASDTAASAEGSRAAEEAEEAAGALDSSRRWALEQLAGVCSLPNVDAAIQTSITRYLITHSFFASPEGAAENIRHLCASRLMTIVEAGGKVQKSDVQAGKKQHERRGENELLRDTVQFLTSEQAEKELLVELAEPIQASLKGLRSVESKLAKAYASSLSSDEEAGRAKANKELAFLHLVRWLQLYIVGDAENVDVELADELANIHQSALSKSSGKKRKSVGETTPWQDRLVDVLLSLSAYSSAQLPSVPLREAVEAVFRAFASDISQTGVEDIVRVIARPYDNAQDAEDAVMEEDDDEEEDGEEGEEEEEASEDESDDEEMTEATDRPDASLEVQGRNGKVHDGGPTSTSDSESEEEGMTDEQMFKMDEMLVAVLKTQKDAKSSAKLTKQAMVNFKLRAIALLEAFSKAVPHSPFIAPQLGQLVKAAAAESKQSGSQAVSERLRGVIAKLCRSKPIEADCRSIPPESISKSILAAHVAAAKSQNKSISSCADAAIHYLVSISVLANSEGHRRAASSACNQILAHLFKRRDLHIPFSLLSELARRHPEIAESYLPELISHIETARTPFLQIQAAQLLGVAAKAIRQAPTAEVTTKLASAVITAVQGDRLPSAQKHADCLKNLAAAWQSVSKRFPKSIQGAKASTISNLKAECIKAHAIAANGKVSHALAQIGTVIALDLGPFDPNAPKRTYKDSKASASKSKRINENRVKAKAGSSKEQPNGKETPKSTQKRVQPDGKLANGKPKKAKPAAAEASSGPIIPAVSGVIIEDTLADPLQKTGLQAGGADKEVTKKKRKKEKKRTG